MATNKSNMRNRAANAAKTAMLQEASFLLLVRHLHTFRLDGLLCF